MAERITGLAGVPSLWALLVHSYAALEKQNLRLRYITNTGGALPLPVLEKLRAALPETEVILMYGLTEAFRSTYLPAAELDRRPGSMGRAIPNTELLVVDEAGRRCEPGQVGELVHHGPTVSLGYWGQPELTDRVIRPHPFPRDGGGVPDRVCYSGDLVRQDAEGYFYFIGRRDNLIKSSGFRISPTEVEEGLMASGPLQAAAVIGLPFCHVLYLSNVRVFAHSHRIVRSEMLRRTSTRFAAIARRLLQGIRIPQSFPLPVQARRLIRSQRLEAHSLDFLYSEVSYLNLCPFPNLRDQAKRLLQPSNLLSRRR
ncbi:AMP-binding protein [Candidatus Laterigemmans baculatus]|uniref:AMP-binding protein n=1 Tax=Candidatus Laterigemmans baculatus TaxID=2770505 RepID=UPI00193AE472|nr:AMP-binding protein [Candidatus Laterigemmans baculatus]